MQLAGHPPAFLHTHRRHLKGGKCRTCFQLVCKCLERPTQRELCVHKGTSNSQNSTERGTWIATLGVTCTSHLPLQRLFREIVLWRRLSHPNILPVLGVAPKLFPFCIITEWMENGNIMDFVSKHPDVNRLRLVRQIFLLPPSSNSDGLHEAGRSSQRITLSAFDVRCPR